MTLLERVQFLCNRKNLTVARLEQELGFSRGSIYKWSTSTPSGDKLKTVANYFNVTVDFLLGNDVFYVDPYPEFDDLCAPNEALREAFSEYINSREVTISEISEETSIPQAWLADFLSVKIDGLSIYIWNIMFDDYFNYDFYDFLNDYNLYMDYIPPQFNGDAGKYEASKAAIQQNQETNSEDRKVEIELQAIARKYKQLPPNKRKVTVELINALLDDSNFEEEDDL